MAARRNAALLLIAVLALAGAARAISFAVDAHKEECFYEDVEKDVKVMFTFEVSDGGSMDIDVRVVGPDERVIYAGDRETEGKVPFMAHMTGTYRFCFSNKMSTMTAKTLHMFVSVGDAPSKSTIAKPEDLSPIEQSVLLLADGLNAIQTEQRYMRGRERVHRNTSESTNARVLWWSFLEAVVLVAMSIWQIYYLRRFFEVKSIL